MRKQAEWGTKLPECLPGRLDPASVQEPLHPQGLASVGQLWRAGHGLDLGALSRGSEAGGEDDHIPTPTPAAVGCRIRVCQVERERDQQSQAGALWNRDPHWSLGQPPPALCPAPLPSTPRQEEPQVQRDGTTSSTVVSAPRPAPWRKGPPLGPFFKSRGDGLR